MDEIGEIHSLMPCASCGMMDRNLIQALSAVNYKQYLILLQTELSELLISINNLFFFLIYPIVLKWHYGLGANLGPQCRKAQQPANKDVVKQLNVLLNQQLGSSVSCLHPGLMSIAALG